MKEKVKAGKFTLFLCLGVLCMFLICSQAPAAQLMPMQVGQWFQANKYYVNNQSNDWTVHGVVVGQVTLGGKQYMHTRQINYTGSGDVSDLYFRSTDTQVFMYSASGEYPPLGTGPVGTTWTYTNNTGKTVKATIVKIGPLTVPYGSYATAYKIEHHDVYQNGTTSESWYDWIVPGVGNVREAAYLGGEDTNSVMTAAGIDPLCQDATYTGDGWESSSLFGNFDVDPSPWIYHQTLGWLYPLGTSTDSIWIWAPQWDGTGGWWWTSSSVYPWVYSTIEGWLYFDAKDSTPAARWFFNGAGKASTH